MNRTFEPEICIGYPRVAPPLTPAVDGPIPHPSPPNELPSSHELDDRFRRLSQGNESYVEAFRLSTDALGITSGTVTDICSFPLKPGDWMVGGQVVFVPANTSTVTAILSSFNTVSATTPDTDTFRTAVDRYAFTGTGTATLRLPLTSIRLRLKAVTTVYLLGLCVFGASTCTAYGTINAWRIR